MPWLHLSPSPHPLQVSAMNMLQAMMSKGTSDGRAMFWGDMFNIWHSGARTNYQQINGGYPGPTYTPAAAVELDKAIIHIPWCSGYDDSPIVNCSAPNPGRDCPLQCDNPKCAMENENGFYEHVGIDWIAGTGQKPSNIQTWARLQHGHKRALGTMATQWHDVDPDTSGLPSVGEYGWNQAQVHKTTGCADA